VNLRLYRAFTMAEALDAVKRDLGPDASIVHTRTFRRGGFLGIGRRTVVEVTATVDPKRSTRREAPRNNPRHAEARRAYRERRTQNRVESKSSASSKALEANRLDLLAAIEQHRRDAESAQDRSTAPVNPAEGRRPQVGVPTNSGAQERGTPAPGRGASPMVNASAASHPSLFAHPQEKGAAAASTRSADAASTRRQSPPADAAPGVDRGAAVSPVARRFILKSTSPEPATPPQQAHGGAASGGGAASPGPRSESSLPDLGRTMQEEMFAIRSMVSKVLEQQERQRHHRPDGRSEPDRQMPRALFDFYLRLVGQELSDELADQIVASVEEELGPEELADGDTLRRAVLRRLEELIPVADTPVLEAATDGRPLTVALIGPTGVGKTTTLAKLAATFKLHHGKSVGLVTSDTYRIAAVEQLRTYANIIGLPVKVVLTPPEMRQACHQLRECDVILIDTAGRSQRDRGKLEELQQFIDAADPHEVHLVLSSTASERVLVQEAEAFSQVRCDKIILTKLDEAVSFGTLVNVVRTIGKNLSFVTTGQEVPDHIEPGRTDRLANLVLGGEL